MFGDRRANQKHNAYEEIKLCHANNILVKQEIWLLEFNIKRYLFLGSDEFA